MKTNDEKSRAEAQRESKAPSLEDLVAAITPENRHDEISTGAPVGRESIDW